MMDLLKCYVAAWNGVPEVDLEQILDPGFRRVADPMSESATGVAGLRALIDRQRLEVPDLSVTRLDAVLGQANAAVRWRIEGTDSGPGGSLPSTGKRFDVEGLSVFHFKEGHISREWTIADNVTLLRQLGFTIGGASPAS